MGLRDSSGRWWNSELARGPTDTAVEEHEHQRCLAAFVGEAVLVAAADTFEQAVRFHFAQIVAELAEGVGAGAEAEGGEDGCRRIAIR